MAKYTRCMVENVYECGHTLYQEVTLTRPLPNGPNDGAAWTRHYAGACHKACGEAGGTLFQGQYAPPKPVWPIRRKV